MKYVKNIMAVLVIGLFVSGTAFAADVDGGLTVGDVTAAPGATATVAITLDNGDGEVGGVAFTLTYNADSLTFVGLTAVETQALADPESVSEVDASTLYYQANGDTAGQVMVAAASASAVAAGTIFNVEFTVSENATVGDELTIDIEQSTISNTSAGYSADGEKIAALVGLPDGDNFTTTLTDGTLTVGSACIPGDISCLLGGEPGTVVDIFDLLAIVDLMGFSSGQEGFIDGADINSDDTIDIFDVLGVVDLMP